jgi:hypothetical protein
LESVDISFKARGEWKSQQILHGTQDLDLSHRGIESIDLSITSELDKLERLFLNNNQLTEIDLDALQECRDLREINLKGNKLTSLDITPLYRVRPFKIYIDTTVKVYADPILKYITAITPGRSHQFTKMDWLKYTQFVSNHGWTRLKERILRILESLPEIDWFPAQLGLLEELRMSELAGIDTNPLRIIEPIAENIGPRKVRNQIYKHCVSLLKTQLENAGSTHFLDIMKLATSEASVLIPMILELRSQEMQGMTLDMKGEYVDITPLWFSVYGAAILESIGIRSLEVKKSELIDILDSLEDAGYFVEVETRRKRKEGARGTFSFSLQKFIMDSVIYGKSVTHHDSRVLEAVDPNGTLGKEKRTYNKELLARLRKYLNSKHGKTILTNLKEQESFLMTVEGTTVRVTRKRGRAVVAVVSE